MARFTFMHIEFFVVPSKKELVRINKLFSMLDYDFPEFGFTEKGFYGDWRKPLCLLRKFLIFYIVMDIQTSIDMWKIFILKQIFLKKNQLRKIIQSMFANHMKNMQKSLCVIGKIPSQR